MSGLSFLRGVRGLALAVGPLLVVLSGCESKYPADLTYPVRKDLLVITPPSKEPFYPSPPGHLDPGIAEITSLGGKTYNPSDVSAADRQELGAELQKVFGTPANPLVDVGNNTENADRAKELQLDKEMLADGSELYRRHCLHCHGLTGDGRGPTGPWLAPSPRDYRQGLFKFISVDREKFVGNAKARRADLKRTLLRGIDGTTMPSFSMFTEKEIDHLVSYVIHLSIRGEVEFQVLAKMIGSRSPEQVKQGLPATKESLTDGSFAAEIQAQIATILEHWSESNKAMLEPTPYPYQDDKMDGEETQLQKSIRRGYQQFANPSGAAACMKCHIDFGRQVPFRYDQWGTFVRPANLTTGVYRGGRRPIDIYWRIRVGILPSSMSAATYTPTKTIDPYWDIVNFVRALPYPGMLPKDVRDKVYDVKKEPASHQEHASR